MPGALPTTVDADKVYVIPTRIPARTDGEAAELCFTDNVRYLPKAARARGLPVEFAHVEGERRYLQEFSRDPEMWALGLALLSMANAWLILTVELFIAHRADQQGWTPEEAKQLPLKVRVAETKTRRTYEIEGSGLEVIEALKVLQREAAKKEDEKQDAGS